MTPSWDVIAGRCGACLRFQKDFGGTGRVYGHCGRKPRSGSISSNDFKCDSYAALPGVEEEVAPVDRAQRKQPTIDVFADAESLVRLARTRDEGRTRRPKRQPKVRRRATRHDRDHELIDWGEDWEDMDRETLRNIIQEAIEESMGVGEIELLDRFKGGEVIIQPGEGGGQPKTVPIDTLLRKIVMVRDNLRVLEQKVNQHQKLEDTDRVQLQQYITRCYGSLTTFNALFQDRDDWFKGSGS